jgi:hypothetical protein
MVSITVSYVGGMVTNSVDASWTTIGSAIVSNIGGPDVKLPRPIVLEDVLALYDVDSIKGWAGH